MLIITDMHETSLFNSSKWASSVYDYSFFRAAVVRASLKGKSFAQHGVEQGSGGRIAVGCVQCAQNESDDVLPRITCLNFLCLTFLLCQIYCHPPVQ